MAGISKTVEIAQEYDSLFGVLMEALQQASEGKGKERHAVKSEDFEKQQICEIPRRLSIDFNLGQVVKKVYEVKNLETQAAINELLGAINYLAGAIIVLKEKINE